MSSAARPDCDAPRAPSDAGDVRAGDRPEASPGPVSDEGPIGGAGVRGRPPARHPAFELMARYAAVLQASWQLRAELAGPSRLRDERAFLPAALSLQETPVHPAPRRAAWAILALATVTLAWTCIGRVDIVAVAPGRIIPGDHSKVVQPLESGIVKAIHVRDGDRVRAGQLLLELDPTQATADHRSVQEQERVARGELERVRRLLAALRGGQAPVIPEGAQQSDADLLRAEWDEMTSRLARLQTEAARRQAELGTVQELIAKLESTLPIVRRREADIKALSEDGAVPAHMSQDRTRERIELERDLAMQQSRRQEAEAALAESRKSHAAAQAEVERALQQRQTKALADLTQIEQQGSKSAQREQLTRLVAPVTGTVQQLAVHTPGGVVTPAQPLMVVVPEGGVVTAEVMVDNTEIGFVRPGQAVEVKLETFNFTRYGTVPGRVLHVASDAVVDEKRGAVFPATVSFATDAIDVDGRHVRLSPGLNVTAEIKTGRRRVIDFLLSPVQRTLDQSWRER